MTRKRGFLSCLANYAVVGKSHELGAFPCSWPTKRIAFHLQREVETMLVKDLVGQHPERIGVVD